MDSGDLLCCGTDPGDQQMYHNMLPRQHQNNTLNHSYKRNHPRSYGLYTISEHSIRQPHLYKHESMLDKPIRGANSMPATLEEEKPKHHRKRSTRNNQRNDKSNPRDAGRGQPTLTAPENRHQKHSLRREENRFFSKKGQDRNSGPRPYDQVEGDYSSEDEEYPRIKHVSVQLHASNQSPTRKRHSPIGAKSSPMQYEYSVFSQSCTPTQTGSSSPMTPFSESQNSVDSQFCPLGREYSPLNEPAFPPQTNIPFSRQTSTWPKRTPSWGYHQVKKPCPLADEGVSDNISYLTEAVQTEPLDLSQRQSKPCELEGGLSTSKSDKAGKKGKRGMLRSGESFDERTRTKRKTKISHHKITDLLESDLSIQTPSPKVKRSLPPEPEFPEQFSPFPEKRAPPTTDSSCESSTLSLPSKPIMQHINQQKNQQQIENPGIDSTMVAEINSPLPKNASVGKWVISDIVSTASSSSSSTSRRQFLPERDHPEQFSPIQEKRFAPNPNIQKSSYSRNSPEQMSPVKSQQMGTSKVQIAPILLENLPLRNKGTQIIQIACPSVTGDSDRNTDTEKSLQEPYRSSIQATSLTGYL